MPVVAIAGGTSPGLGRAIVTGIFETYPDGKWTPIILSRSPKAPLWLRAIDPNGTRAPIHQVDYMSKESLLKPLHGVDTLISVALARDGSNETIHHNLLHAAIEAGVRRYVPSDWALPPQPRVKVELLMMLQGKIQEECEKHSDKIEWAFFYAGGFMNYFGIGKYEPDKTSSEEVLLQKYREGGGYAAGDDAVTQGIDREGDMPDGSGSFLASLGSGTMQLPIREDGSSPSMTFTTFRDIGRFVAAALELPKWEHIMTMSGDTVPMNEILKLSEEVTGRKFQVEKLTEQDLQNQIDACAPEDLMKKMWLQLKLVAFNDSLGGSVVPPMVNKLCPNVKPLSVKGYLEQTWLS